jgi:hypothetical protein
MTWHKARAQPSQGVAGRPITLADRPCVGAIPKTVLSTCPTDAVLKVSNGKRWCKEESWPPSQDAWPPGLTSGPHVHNLRPEHRLTPAVNTIVLAPAEGVKKVSFSPPKGLLNSIFVEWRERGKLLSTLGLPSLSEILRVALVWKLC